MELRVIDRSDDALTLEIGGEDHTFMNALKGALLETEHVLAATYDMNPEQSGGQTDPILTLKTDGEAEPLEVLAAASRTIGERVDAFVDAFETAA
ncbi:MAG: DNA-directed RNA polymerase subunit L [Halobacteriota archaeon]